MRKICVVTGTRAEYGLLYWILKEIEAMQGLELQLVVTGAHLSPYQGNTQEQIEKDGFKIRERVDMLLQGDSASCVATAMGLGQIGFARAYAALQPDLLLVLGDRYEILAAVSAALPFALPVVHLHGGESTEGAIDEQIRHAITKMSHLHLTACEEYAVNVRRMGEEAWRVHTVGAPGLEWLRRSDCLSKDELQADLGLDFSKPVLLVTFHPVTLEPAKVRWQTEQLLEALAHSDAQVLLTGANADQGGAVVNRLLQEAAADNERYVFRQSLGQRRYLSCMKHCSMVVGNSSSGIIEAASFGVPVVNIGTRQQGRLQNENVINCGYEAAQITEGIEQGRSEAFSLLARGVTNRYGDGCTARKVVDLLREVPLEDLKIKRLSWNDAIC